MTVNKDKPRVKALKGRYKIRGHFSRSELGTPIRNEEGNLRGITNPRDMTYIHSYGGEAPFFEGLSKGRLLATRCDNPDCETKGTMYLPYRIACPDCLMRTTSVDVTDLANEKAEIYTYINTERSGAFNFLPTPIRFLDMAFPGTPIATFLKSYMSGPGEPDFGMRLVPIFNTKNPTFTITDLSWVVPGTKPEDLPEDFTFSL